MLLNDYIMRLYKALKNEDIEEFGDITLDVDDSKIIQTEEDIIHLCRLFTYDFNYMEPHVKLDITRMIFSAMDKGSRENGLKDLVRGLFEIFNKSLEDDRRDRYDSYFKHILRRFISYYNESDMILFGKFVSNIASQEFKTKLLDTIRESLIRMLEEKYVRNAMVLEENIK